MVRRYLFALGYRYRVNYKALPGKPDIVFTKKKIAIFIHGCYWHGHDCGSRYAHSSKSNKTYWGPKIQRTQQRDQEHITMIAKANTGRNESPKTHKFVVEYEMADMPATIEEKTINRENYI